MRTVVITGASTGIGYETAKYLLEHGYHVFGSVRKNSDAERLQRELGSQFTPLLFDVTDDAQIKQASAQVAQQLKGQTLSGLINNAGIAVTGALLTLPLADLQRQFDINVFGQLKVTQAFAPLLGVDPAFSGKPGKIINISSVAGKRTYPFITPYSMSKHALEAFSEGLRRELMPFEIDVIVVAPGAIKTPIWDKAKETPFASMTTLPIYEAPAKKFKAFMLKSADHEALPASDVAKLIWRILESKHPKVRYAPVPRKLINWTIPNLLPKRWLDWIVAKSLGLLPKKK